MARFESTRGRYIFLEIGGIEYRIYFEESGNGVPLLLQHTAGADGRQWRHLLEDEDIKKNFHMIAYDLPYHGKSLPPTDKEWWSEEYRLTTEFLMSVPVRLTEALGLDRPAFMGSSIGGHLALDLARYHADEFRAVVSLEGAAYTPGTYSELWNHPQVSNAYKSTVMLGVMSPTAPECFRRETAWVYSQGSPPVFKGDLYYHGVEHDLRKELGSIDTSKVGVFMLTGEYDAGTPPALSEATAREIAGSEFETMKNLGHFPMSEDPKLFKQYVMPVLEKIRHLN